MSLSFKCIIIAGIVIFGCIGMTNAEVYKWIDKDGVERFSNFESDIPPGIPFEEHNEVIFDPTADAEREKHDKKVMEAVDKEEAEMMKEEQSEEEQAVQKEKSEVPAPTVIVEEEDEDDYWREHEARREKELHDTNKLYNRGLITFNY